MEPGMLLIRHSSARNEEFGDEPVEPTNIEGQWKNAHSPKAPELMEEIRQIKHKTLSKRLDPLVMSSPGRFSFLRRKKAAGQDSANPSGTVEVLTETTFFPKRHLSKDFEFDMGAEVEHEIGRRAKLPPGGENIWG